MTVVFNKPVAGFNNLIDDFFATVPSILQKGQLPAAQRQFTPVNISETENGFILQVIAPGFSREDFSICLDKQILTVSLEKAREKQENIRSIRSEYQFRNFKRSFTLDEKIDAENITAQYVNGVLTLNLPKRETVKPASRQITIE